VSRGQRNESPRPYSFFNILLIRFLCVYVKCNMLQKDNGLLLTICALFVGDGVYVGLEISFDKMRDWRRM
jgi:hypothetical protein